MSSTLRMRPRFRARIPLDPDAARRRLIEAMAAADADCGGPIDDHKVELMARTRHHFWSPELRAFFDAADDGTVLRGRFGPKPAVWTMFMVIYIHLGFIAVAALMYAGAQVTLERAPTALWAVPAAAVAAALVYAASQIGQRLGAGEMERITRFVERTYGVTAETDA